MPFHQEDSCISGVGIKSLVRIDITQSGRKEGKKMDETVNLLYRLFLSNEPYRIVSCIRYGDEVEIKIVMWENTKPFRIMLRPRED